jgi:hypothetical protein
MIGERQQEIAEKAAFEMGKQRCGLGLITNASDEIRQLRPRLPCIGNGRRLG